MQRCCTTNYEIAGCRLKNENVVLTIRNRQSAISGGNSYVKALLQARAGRGGRQGWTGGAKSRYGKLQNPQSIGGTLEISAIPQAFHLREDFFEKRLNGVAIFGIGCYPDPAFDSGCR